MKPVIQNSKLRYCSNVLYSTVATVIKPRQVFNGSMNQQTSHCLRRYILRKEVFHKGPACKCDEVYVKFHARYTFPKCVVHDLPPLKYIHCCQNSSRRGDKFLVPIIEREI
jgi:hypothetical protein